MVCALFAALSRSLVPHNFCLLVFLLLYAVAAAAAAAAATSLFASFVLFRMCYTHTHALAHTYFWPKPAGKRADNTIPIPIRVKAAATRRQTRQRHARRRYVSIT